MHFASKSAPLCPNRWSLPSSERALELSAELVFCAWVFVALAARRAAEYAELRPD